MIYYLLATHLALGALAALAMVPLRVTGAGFPRFINGIALFFLVTGLLAGGLIVTRQPEGTVSAGGPGGAILWMYLAAIVPVAAGVILRGPLPGIRVLLGTASLILAGAGFGMDILLNRVPPAAGPFITATVLGSFATSSLAAGSVCVAMVLGHFYLVIPGLSIRPLIRLCKVVVAALSLRLIFGALAVVAFGTRGGTADGILFLWDDVAMSEGMVFWPRLLVGLVAPLALGVMAWVTARIRSTQSTTGILYVAVIFTIIGEFLGRFLFVTTHLPL
jgi:hypothetical protein